jgi:hypothetical protein
MNENRQVQKELFEDFVCREKARHTKGIFNQNPKFAVTLRLEHLVFIAIGFIVLFAIIFSMGVEKGKSMATVSGRDAEVPASGGKDNPPMPEPIAQETVHYAKQVTALERVQDSEASKDVFTVQVASYIKKDAADSYVQRLKAQGYDAFTLKRGDYHVICVGRFSEKPAAEAEMKKLRKTYHDCLVRKI